MLFVCYLLFYEEDKFEIFDGIDEKYNEIDDRVNIEILVEDKQGESDINDGKGEEIFIQEIDNDLNDIEKFQGLIELLMLMEEKRLDGGFEKDDEENDDVIGNGDVFEDENVLENIESDENKEDRF